jgi:hypothetical protein
MMYALLLEAGGIFSENTTRGKTTDHLSPENALSLWDLCNRCAEATLCEAGGSLHIPDICARNQGKGAPHRPLH